MNIFRQLAAVRVAQQRVATAREAWDGTATALLARGVARPLTTVGVAAGAGVVLGSLHVHPLRVPGLGALLSGSLADTLAFATRLLVEFGVAGVGARARASAEPQPATDVPTASTLP